MADSREIIYRDKGAIIAWLTLCALLVAAMVLVGGYTRLSGSGLSITEWKPIHGVMPPVSEAEWQEEFAAYQQSPQFQKVNSDMTLEGFKTIFWPEYWHRVLGRIIGIVFFFPLLFFAQRRSISKRFGFRLAFIFALGGLQGLVGWLMVASGLVDDPRVSHIRLALHLSLAFVIYALIVWAVLDLTPRNWRLNITRGSSLITINRVPLLGYSLWVFGVFIQIVVGALLAGLHGGLVYNTWPTMNGEIVPPGLLEDTVTTIQFLHRKLAVLLVAGFLFWWYYQRQYVKNSHLGKVCACVVAIMAVQVTLGVKTLLFQVPLHLALAHQMTALLLFTVALILLHRLKEMND